MSLANQRVAYFNGKIVPESEVLIPFRDRGVKYGDAVFDTTRTFGHKLFKVKEHIDRLYRSLRYLRIDPGLSPAEFSRITEEVTARNLPLIGKDDDYWVTQRVTRGLDPADRAAWPDMTGPTVIVESLPLPLKARAKLYRDGLEVMTPSVRRTAPDMISPRAKTHNYLNMVLADLEVIAQDPTAQAILLDTNGNLAEGKGSNIFIVSEGVIYTPLERYVLPGISRETVFDLAKTFGIPLIEKDIDLYDAYTAEECFISSTSFCVCPVATVNGARIGDGKIPGPITQKIMRAYVDFVGFDWVQQYLERIDA
jgi:branched-chain amino acid aminotransferase